MLADLHLHLYGCIPSDFLLDHLAGRDDVLWDWYESAMERAYGAVPETRDIVRRHRAGEPDLYGPFEELFVFGDPDAGNFERFQAKFNLIIAGSHLSVGEPLDALRAEVTAVAAAVRAAHRRAHVTYAEQRFLFGTTLTSPADVAVLDALMTTFSGSDGPTERLAISLPRQDPWLGWDRVRELVLGPHGDVLTAIDFCFFEEGFPPKEKADFFDAVKQFNAEHPHRALAILYHVGESFTDKSLESAVRWVQEAAELGVHRLGHAIALGIDPLAFGPHTRTETVAERLDQIEYDLTHAAALRARGVPVDPATLAAERQQLLGRDRDATIAVTYDDLALDHVRRRQDFAMARVRATGAVVEVCPTSNRRIGNIATAEHHPIHRFLAAGLPVVIASDDPGLFGTTLERELDWACTATGGGDDLRRDLVARSWASRSEILSGRAVAPPR